MFSLNVFYFCCPGGGSAYSVLYIVTFHRGNLVLLLGRFSLVVSAQLNAKILSQRKSNSNKVCFLSWESSLDRFVQAQVACWLLVGHE